MPWEKLHVPSDKEWKELLKVFEKEAGFSYLRRAKYFVDENLGEGTTQFLRHLKANVTDVWEQGLVGRGDDAVWRFCQKQRRILLSHDDDFLNEKFFPIRKSHGYVVLPHKSGGEAPLLGKLNHLVAAMKGGAGFLYETKVILRENNHWEIRRIGETGAIEIALYDMSDPNHVFELKV